MNKVRELKIDSTLWATRARLVNLLDFKVSEYLFFLKSKNFVFFFFYIKLWQNHV